MKTHQLTITTLLLTFFLTSNISAQTIDSLKIIPTNPTTADTVKIITFFSWGGWEPCLYNLIDDSVLIQNLQIYVQTSYYFDNAIDDSICSATDTFTIGKLANGNYVLYRQINDTPLYDIDTIFLTIQQASGLQATNYSEREINVYPNPTTTEIIIDIKTHSADRYNIDIYSVLGQKLKTFKTEKKIISVDISDLADSIYFIVITNGHERRWTEK